MSRGKFLGTWVSPRCAQSMVLEVHEQLLGHLPIDKEILTPTSFPGSPMTKPQSTKTTTANPITNATEARIAIPSVIFTRKVVARDCLFLRRQDSSVVTKY